MGITQLNAKCLGRIDSRVHAGQDEVFLRGRQREMPLGEARRVLRRRCLHILLDCRHS